MKNSTERFIAYLESNIESCERSIAKFAAEVVKDPLHALSWSGDHFSDAAKLNVSKRCLYGLQHGGTLESVYQAAMDEAMRLVRFPKHSTSPCSNYASQCEGAAWAEMAEQAMAFNKAN